MRVVFDTVVYIRALMNPRGTWARAANRASDYTICISEDIILEILEAMRAPEMRRKLRRMTSVPPLQRLLHLLSSAEVVEPAESITICRDPDDDKIFECAAAAKADYIVSKDKDVLAIGEFRGARTITAADFLALLESR